MCLAPSYRIFTRKGARGRLTDPKMNESFQKMKLTPFDAVVFGNGRVSIASSSCGPTHTQPRIKTRIAPTNSLAAAHIFRCTEVSSWCPSCVASIFVGF
jgi:hypothetical protein